VSDASFLLLFLAVPLLYALWWLAEDALFRAPAALVAASLLLVAMVALVVWMVVALRDGAGAP
jgi:hypothetical protein